MWCALLRLVNDDFVSVSMTQNMDGAWYLLMLAKHAMALWHCAVCTAIDFGQSALRF